MYTVQPMLCQYTICGMATHARLRHASHEVWAARPRSSWLDRWCAERRPRCPQIFKRFHAAYVDAVCNPFYSVNMVRHPSAYVWFLDFFFLGGIPWQVCALLEVRRGEKAQSVQGVCGGEARSA